jgi:hypothetical protein
MTQPISSRAKCVEAKPLTSTTWNAVAWVEARTPITLKTYKPFAVNVTSHMAIRNNTRIF